MVSNDTLTIRPPTPLAFVLANGDRSQATNTSRAHLLQESKLTIPRVTTNLELCCSLC